MDAGAVLKSFIYIISSSLLYPVLLILVLLIIWTIVCYGGFFTEWVSRKKLKPCFPEDLPEMLLSGSYHEYLPYQVRFYVEKLNQVVRDKGDFSEVRIENILQETTMDIYGALDRVKMVIRIGPGLGLIGTLIPMGTGLAALGQGDITKLSSDLVIAFTTTVVGLAAGLAAYFCFTVKERWADQDVKNMELATEVLTSEREYTKAA